MPQGLKTQIIDSRRWWGMDNRERERNERMGKNEEVDIKESRNKNHGKLNQEGKC